MTDRITKAFARPHSCCKDLDTCMLAQEGMLLRDYFAIKVLAGYLASCVEASESRVLTCKDQLGEFAYQIADAMLEAREK